MNTIASTSAKNHYETLIDNLMLQEVAGHNPELYNILLNADPRKRRYGILSILDKDRNMFLSIKNIIKQNAVSKTEHIKDVVRMLRDYVKVGEVEKKKFGEVMTPISLVNEMLDTLPVEVWYNPDLKWLDPANGCGVFPSVVVERLMTGLESWQPNEELRYKHIMENMIYVCELQPKNMFLFLCAFDPNDEYELNVYTGSFLDAAFDEHMKNVWGIDKFDIVVGNVPYQDELITKKGSARPLYNLFTEKAAIFSDKILYVTPSRWFAGGKGLDDFRNFMLKGNKISIIKHFSDSSIFWGKSVQIEGGVSYFLWDKTYNGLCEFDGKSINLKEFDIIYDFSYETIVKKVISDNHMGTICVGQSFSGINSNDVRLKTEMSDGDVKCYVSKVNGFIKFIPRNEIKKTANIDGWKVFTARANGSYPKFGNIFVGEPNSVCNQSYIVFNVHSESEANSLVTYLKSKFANKLLSLRKISQDIKPDTCKWIPLVPFDREWTDEQLFEYFSLTEEEIQLILK